MFFASLSLTLLLVACNIGGTKEGKDGKILPLTGLQGESEGENRAVAVTISNHPSARPQSGLAEADIVYEVLMEGDITRFLAIFQSEKPQEIGPVRSARDYLIQLSQGYDSMYVAHGYSPSAKEMLDSGKIDQINGIQHDGTLFERSSDRKPPHNSYITYDNIIKGAEKNDIHLTDSPVPLPFSAKDEEKNLTGIESDNIELSYSENDTYKVKYEYDAKKGKYVRLSGEEQMNDILIDNIFIVVMEHETIDEKGRRAIDLQSGGEALLLQKGLVQEVEWKNVDGRILPYLNGEQLAFLPGKTWINIVPDQYIIDYTS